MKKIVLIICIAIASSFVAMGQSSPHINQYWIPYYYCGLSVDSVCLPAAMIGPFNVIGSDTLFEIGTTIARRPNNHGELWGNAYYDCPLGLFQQFQTDTTLNVIGIAAWIVVKPHLYGYIDSSNYTLQIRDSNFNVLVDTVCWARLPYIIGGYGNIGWREFMFAKGEEVTINPGVFRIGFMDPTGGSFGVLAKKDTNCPSPLPILGLYHDPDTLASIVDIGSAGNSRYCGGGRFGNSIMFILPIVAEDTDTIPDSSSLKPNVMVERYSQIYPNPAQNEITVACSFAIQSIELYNPGGQRVLSRQANKAHTIAIDVSTLSKGVYLCKIQTAKGWTSKKVIVQ